MAPVVTVMIVLIIGYLLIKYSIKMFKFFLVAAIIVFILTQLGIM